MNSMIWISQTAVRLADTDLFATILCSLILMWILMSFKGDEERGETNLFQYLIAVYLYFCTSTMFRNKNTLPLDERTTVNPKRQNKKANENPPPVLVENPKKKQKKGKRSTKKNFCKENTEPTVIKKETKMFSSWDICGKLNRDPKSIYEHLLQFTLSNTQLRMNYFPMEGSPALNQVAADDSKRLCARCQMSFDIYNGVHLSSSMCHYHPRKAAIVSATNRTRVHGCCNLPQGSAACAVSNNHVTVQHRPRALTKTSSRRHVRRDLQNGIFALDCEMCYTTDGLEVCRVGLVNINGLAVYDGFVKPKNKVLDYNTLYSGVEENHLRGVTVHIEDVKKILSGYIQEDTILVGHALNNDLSALGLIHKTIVDTSVLYTDPLIPTKKIALKTLASSYLGLNIQDSVLGHDCIDDARASLQLALLKVPASVPRPLTEPVPEEIIPSYQQEPLGEIQNFSPRFQIKSQYDDGYHRAIGFQSPVYYNPNLCYTQYVRGGV